MFGKGIGERRLYTYEQVIDQIESSRRFGHRPGIEVTGKMLEVLGNPQKDIPPVTISAGVAFSEEGFTEDLFAKADKALYEAKEGGRSRCCFAAVEDITDENGGGIG